MVFCCWSHARAIIILLKQKSKKLIKRFSGSRLSLVFLWVGIEKMREREEEVVLIFCNIFSWSSDWLSKIFLISSTILLYQNTLHLFGYFSRDFFCNNLDLYIFLAAVWRRRWRLFVAFFNSNLTLTKGNKIGCFHECIFRSLVQSFKNWVVWHSCWFFSKVWQLAHSC